MSIILNIKPGDKYGRLKLIKKLPRKLKPSGQKHTMWLAKCDCGNVREFIQSNLRHKTRPTISCGCAHIESITKYAVKKVKNEKNLYNIWRGMIARCHDSKNRSYAKYGARGIKVCKKWHDYCCFHKDMATSYRFGLSIDRIDNSQGYSPSNCRWADNFQQAQNKTNNVFIYGQCMAKICRDNGINYRHMSYYKRKYPERKLEDIFDQLLVKAH